MASLLRINGKTADMWAVIDALLRLAPDGHTFTKPDEKHKAKYIPLSVQVSKSTIHKNAVSVHDDYISFMVKDWTKYPIAEGAGFKPQQNIKRGKRLHLYDISLAKIEVNQDLFRKLLIEADVESRDRQKTQPRKANK